MAQYPEALTTFTTKRDASATTAGDHVLAAHVNALQTAVSNIEKWVGRSLEYPAHSPGETVGTLLSQTRQLALTNVPVGTIIAFAGTVSSTNLPYGYLVCDGSPIPPDEPPTVTSTGKDYSQLRTVLGTGANVPDLRERFLKGTGPSTAAGPAPPVTEVPQHSHGINISTDGTSPSQVTSTGGGHSHQVLASTGPHSHRLSTIYSTLNVPMVTDASLDINFPDLEVRRANGGTFNLKALNNNPKLRKNKLHHPWLYSDMRGAGGLLTTEYEYKLIAGGTYDPGGAPTHNHDLGGHAHNITNKATNNEGTTNPKIEPASYAVVYLIRAF